MKHSKLIVSLAALAAMLDIGAAFAADLPARSYSKTPAIAVDPGYNWSGFYIGGNIGGVWNRSDWTDITGNIIGANQTVDSTGSAVIGGGQIGFNYQISQFVFGVESDYEATRSRSSFGSNLINPGCAGAPPGICTTSQNWVASVRGRAGFAFDRFLVYGTGGVAFTEIAHVTDFPGFNFPFVYGTQSRTGWVAGLGAEYAITSNLIAGVEWKYYDFGTISGVAAPPNVDAMRFRETENSVVARLSYKFGWGSPVVAKY